MKVQAITDNSTAEECVKVIEDAAKTAIGIGEDPIIAVSFNGSKFSIVFNSEGGKIHSNTYIQNWRNLDIYVNDEKDGLISLELVSDEDFIDEDYVEYPVGSSVFRTDYKIYKSSLLIIDISANQSKRKDDVILAAKQLQKLASKKENLFKLDSPNKKIKAILDNPKYKEAVTYINEFIDVDYKYNRLKYGRSSQYQKIKLGFDEMGDLMLMTTQAHIQFFSSKSPNSGEKEHYIKLKNVKDIRIVKGKRLKNDIYQFGLWFVEKNKTRTPEMQISAWDYKLSDEKFIEEKKESEFYKTFEHLCKMATDISR